MRRKAWAMIRNGVMGEFFYVMEVAPIPGDFYMPQEVSIVGPFNIEAPPPPLDFLSMSSPIYSPELGRWVNYVGQNWEEVAFSLARGKDLCEHGYAQGCRGCDPDA
jgi:hypothetical protein